MGRFINADALASTGQGLLGNNMFAYCNNNPVIAADNNGKWFTVVIGAAAGALVSGITTALQGGSRDEIMVSAICGAFSGVFAATGAGGILGQVVVGAVSSAVDSGFQNYNEYIAGEQSLSQAVTGTLIDAALGAAFGAMGYEGNDALKNSDTISGNTINALKTLVKRGLHPKIKSTAKATVRAGGRYILKEAQTAFCDNFITSVVTAGLSSSAGLLY